MHRYHAIKVCKQLGTTLEVEVKGKKKGEDCTYNISGGNMYLP